MNEHKLFILAESPIFFSYRKFNGVAGFRIEDTLRLSFRDNLFLPSLTPETVLDYLRISPFWSPTCLNERLIEKHLRQTPENLRALGDAEEEFIVGASHPPLVYVIYKQRRYGRAIGHKELAWRVEETDNHGMYDVQCEHKTSLSLVHCQRGVLAIKILSPSAHLWRSESKLEWVLL